MNEEKRHKTHCKEHLHANIAAPSVTTNDAAPAAAATITTPVSMEVFLSIEYDINFTNAAEISNQCRYENIIC